MEYIRTNMHPTEIQKLGTPKVGFADGSVVEGSFEVVGENNQGQAIVVEYSAPGQPGQIRLQRGPDNMLHKPQRPVTKAEFEQWRKDNNFVFQV